VTLRLSFISAGLCLMAGNAGTALAQQNDEPGLSDSARARQLYLEGSSAVEMGRWADAERAFRQSYEVSQNPAALFNLGVSLRALGRHREARDVFARLADLGADLDPEVRSQVESYRSEEAARVAVLIAKKVEGCALLLDGEPVVPSPSGEIEADAGKRVLLANCPGKQQARWEGSLSQGQRAEVRLVARPLPAREASPPPTLAPSPTSDRQSAPWPWIVIGTGTILAASGGVLMIIGSRDAATVEDAPAGSDWSSVETEHDRARLFSWLGPTLAISGGVVVLGGIGWMALGRPVESTSTSLTLSRRGVVLEGRF
jgi:hypothetical protein